MKPLLSAAPATREDRLIWLNINVRNRMATFPSVCTSDAYHESDRRDADLMLSAQSARVGHWGWLVRRVGWVDEVIGGPLPSSQTINPRAAGDIIYCA